MLLKDSIIRFFSTYKIHHVLFWILYFVFWALVYENYYTNLYLLSAVTLAYCIFHALGFYVTAYILVPRYLYQKQIFKFLGIALLLFLMCGIGITGSMFFLMGEKVDEFAGGWLSLFIITTFSTLSIVGILTAAKTVAERYRSQRQADKIKKQNLETELKYLKAQVNPHFLFNVINSIHVLINKDPDKAAKALVKLSQMMRFQLYECSGDVIPVEKEISYLKNYIELEKLRKGNQVRVQFRTDGGLSDFDIAPFLLIPFLENAFKYVSGFKERENRIDIDLQRTDEVFSAHIINTTENGINPNQNMYEGIGIENVRRRLKLLYPQRHSLSINQQENQFTVSLSITLS